MSKRRILIVVDMQNDFVSGTLGSPEAQAIVANVVEKIEQYNDSACAVYYTQDTHEDDYLHTHEGKLLPIAHCINGTHGHELVEDVSDALPLDAKLLEKSTFGCFALVSELLEQADENTVFELVGLCTDICVIANAIIVRTAFADNDVVVDSSCCAGSTPQKHEYALEIMQSCHITVK